MTIARDTVPEIDVARCSGCGWCIASCRQGLLGFEIRGWRKTSVLLDSDRCNGCRKCAAKCPLQAITMHEKAALAGLALT